MNIALLAPLGLAALAALIIPILIHLIRRLEFTTTEFAAVRWISERISAQRRLRFERPWLLAIRLLLLALLALLLAKPVVEQTRGASVAWVVVAPGVDRLSARSAVADSAAQWHWLAPGFPTTDTDVTSAPVPLASLLRELDADLPMTSSLTVIVPAEVAGLDGERLHLRHAVDWRVVPGRMATSDRTAAKSPVRLSVRYEPADESSLVYLRAAVAAWNVDEPDRYRLDVQTASVPVGSDVQWLVWLGGTPPASVTEWIDQGGVAFLTHHAGASGDIVWRDATGSPLAWRDVSAHGRTIFLHGALTPMELPLLLDADFPARLRAALQGPTAGPTRADAHAVEPAKTPEADSNATTSFGSARPLDPWLVVLIAALFLLERIVATRPRTAVVA